MADFDTLADLTRYNDKNIKDYGVTNLFQKSPLLDQMPASIASQGVVDVYTRITVAPNVGFRTLYHGALDSVGASETVSVMLSILAESNRVDQRAADIYAGGTEAFIQKKVNANLQTGYAKTEAQLLYGNGFKLDGVTASGNASANILDASGFSGLADQDSVAYKDSAMVVDAQGTGTACSDIWILCLGDDEIEVVTGQNGKVTIGTSVSQMAYQVINGTADMTRTYPIWYTPIEGWIGCRYGSLYSAARIVNIDAGAHGATDNLVYAAIEKLVDKGKTPSKIVMSGRSQFQIRQSRTAVNETGEAAPLPDNIAGIPIVVSPNVRNNLTAIGAHP